MLKLIQRDQPLTESYPPDLSRAEYEAGVVDPHCGARPLTRACSSQLLATILQHSEGGTMLFDLDSTLLDNGPRNALIMREYGERAGLPILTNAHARHWQDWDARRAMANIGLSADQIAKHHDDYDNFWGERFFSSEYCAHDELTPGASAFVTRALDGGARVVYLTGRPENMREGTLACFARLGVPLPQGPRIELTMKPLADSSDDDFKRDCAQALGEREKIVAAFDNEPQHINTYHALLPQTACVHLFTDHSMRSIALADGIASIRNFL